MLSRTAITISGRMFPEDFRAKLEEHGVIADLERLGLWRGDGPRLRGDRYDGFTFGDLYQFYSYCNPSPVIAAIRQRDRSGSRLIASAKLIRRGLKAFDWTRSVHDSPPWMTYGEGYEVGDEVKILRLPTVIGDLHAAILKYADDVEQLGISLTSRGGRKRDRDAWLFRGRWEAFAMERTAKKRGTKTGKGVPLDEIGASVFAIVFGREIDVQSYRRQRERDRSERGETKRR